MPTSSMLSTDTRTLKSPAESRCALRVSSINGATVLRVHQKITTNALLTNPAVTNNKRRRMRRPCRASRSSDTPSASPAALRPLITTGMTISIYPPAMRGV